MERRVRRGGMIRLKGLSDYGIQNVSRHGEIWEVRNVGKFAAHIKSLQKTYKLNSGKKEYDQRLIPLNTGKDFDIVEIIS